MVRVDDDFDIPPFKVKKIAGKFKSPKFKFNKTGDGKSFEKMWDQYWERDRAFQSKLKSPNQQKIYDDFVRQSAENKELMKRLDAKDRARDKTFVKNVSRDLKRTPLHSVGGSWSTSKTKKKSPRHFGDTFSME